MPARKRPAACRLQTSTSRKRCLSPEAPSAKLGNREYKLGSPELGQLLDSSSVIRSCEQHAWVSRLRERLRDDGYLYLRGLLPLEAVGAARRCMLMHLKQLGLLQPGSRIEEGRVAGTGAGSSQTHRASDSGEDSDAEDVSQREEVLNLLSHPALLAFLEALYNRPPAVVSQPNFRAVKPGQSTGFHVDSVYMGKRMGSEVLTCWMPVMDIPANLGGLAVLRGSNSLPGLAHVRATYGKLDLDEGDIGGSGWFTEDPAEVARFDGRWETSEYSPGDVVIFTMHTFHGSTVNRTDRWRLSFDIRFRPLSIGSEDCEEEWENTSVPNEGRWSQHRHNPAIFPRTMEMAKEDWGLTWQQPRRPQTSLQHIRAAKDDDE